MLIIDQSFILYSQNQLGWAFLQVSLLLFPQISITAAFWDCILILLCFTLRRFTYISRSIDYLGYRLSCSYFIDGSVDMG